jgi:hypothetical protein
MNPIASTRKSFFAVAVFAIGASIAKRCGQNRLGIRARSRQYRLCAILSVHGLFVNFIVPAPNA